MHIHVFPTPELLGKSAARAAAKQLRSTIKDQGFARLILATGTSQFQVLKFLVQAKNVAWDKVTVFHLDEYLGMNSDHPASFRKYLHERFVEKVPALNFFHDIQGEASDPIGECKRLNALIKAAPIDLALIGIGENGHLAFNDPPADFEIEDPYIVVNLDFACRQQQLGEGWFPNLESVPKQAISMSIRQIMKSNQLIVSVPDLRKAQAVKCTVHGRTDPNCPASILQQHGNCELYLDSDSNSLL